MSETTDRKAIRLILVEWITTLGVFLACFLFLLHRIEALEAKQDLKIQEIRQEGRMDRQTQSERSDKLYEMFYELLKEQRK